MKNKVIATSWHPGGANAIIPVIKRLQNDIEVEVIGHGFSEGVFKMAGIDYKTIVDYHINNISTNYMMKMEDLEKKFTENYFLQSTLKKMENLNFFQIK